jgi:hypothetical protein
METATPARRSFPLQRRQLTGLLVLGPFILPSSEFAQSSERPRRLGVLMAYASSDAEAVERVTAFTRELQRLGWTDGRNLRIEYRWASGNVQHLATHAAELVGLRPDAIFAATTPVVRALLQETRDIPVVFVSVSDPVGDRLVAGLARPAATRPGSSTSRRRWPESGSSFSSLSRRASFAYRWCTTQTPRPVQARTSGPPSKRRHGRWDWSPGWWP